MAEEVAVVAVAVVAVVVVGKIKDRIGLGWRNELSAGIFSNLDKIDVLEVVADNYFKANKKSIDALKFLSKQVPLSLHGVGMGLASSQPVLTNQLEKMAQLVDKIEPEFWSEHLAFVRADGIEIGHLAAAPRNQQTIDSTIKNINTAKRVIGSLPQIENIATLIDPPASCFSETEWINQIIEKSEAPLLLDLHNLYANALNFSKKPIDVLLQMPLRKVSTVHLSGGCWIPEPSGGGKRLLDDHIHDVPKEVFELLSIVAKNCQQSLTVIIERDGNYPLMDHLLYQITEARRALSLGRQQQRGQNE